MLSAAFLSIQQTGLLSVDAIIPPKGDALPIGFSNFPAVFQGEVIALSPGDSVTASKQVMGPPTRTDTDSRNLQFSSISVDQKLVPDASTQRPVQSQSSPTPVLDTPLIVPAKTTVGGMNSNGKRQYETGLILLPVLPLFVPFGLSAALGAKDVYSTDSIAHAIGSVPARTNIKDNSSKSEGKSTPPWVFASAFIVPAPKPLPLNLLTNSATENCYLEMASKRPSNSLSQGQPKIQDASLEFKFSEQALSRPEGTGTSTNLKVSVGALAFSAILKPIEPLTPSQLSGRVAISSVAAKTPDFGGGAPSVNSAEPAQPATHPVNPGSQNTGLDLAQTAAETPMNHSGARRHDKSESLPATSPEEGKPLTKAETVALSLSQGGNNSTATTPSGNTPSNGNQPTGNLPTATKIESKSEINPANPPPPTREISVKVSHAEMPNVDIRLSDRGGKILLSVRSESPELAQTLRSDLGDLVGRLERKGYQTDTVVPDGNSSSIRQLAAGHLQESSQQDRGDNGAGHPNQQESRRRPQSPPDERTFSLEEVQYSDRERN